MHHTNPVVGRKRNDLIKRGVPIIEVDFSDYLAYKTPPQLTSKEKEREYIDKLKSKLSEYMWVKVMVDPKSKEYLEKENRVLFDKLKILECNIADANSNLVECKANSKNLENHIKSLQAELDEKNRKLKDDAGVLQDALAEKYRELESATETISNFEKIGIWKFIWRKIASR